MQVFSFFRLLVKHGVIPFFVGIHVVACEKSNFGGISSPVCALAGRSTCSGLQKIYSWGYFCILLNSSGLEYV